MALKKMNTLFLAGTLALALAMTGCSSSSSSGETEAEITETEVVESEETESEEIEEAETEEVEDSEDTTFTNSEDTEAAAESEEEEVAEAEEVETENPDWVEVVYQAFLDGDLDTVYEVIEAEGFLDQLTIYDEYNEENETVDFYTINEEYVLAVVSANADDYHDDTYSMVIVGIMSVDSITGEETPSTTSVMISNDSAEYWAETITGVIGGEACDYRSAKIGDSYYEE